MGRYDVNLLLWTVVFLVALHGMLWIKMCCFKLNVWQQSHRCVNGNC